MVYKSIFINCIETKVGLNDIKANSIGTNPQDYSSLKFTTAQIDGVTPDALMTMNEVRKAARKAMEDIKEMAN